LPEILASADVALITLKRGMGAGSLPSKTLSGLASGRPLVVSVDEGSDTWNLVKQAEAGLCVPPEDPSALAQAILSLAQNPELCQCWVRMDEPGLRSIIHPRPLPRNLSNYSSRQLQTIRHEP
jgi:glycosyltransferase involved in cell wall biosynthesis